MKSLAFLTLFLGLVWGRPLVELEAVDRTARIELRVDGEVEAVITGGPPWRAPLDLGREIAPHHLEAVAFDADGSHLGEAEQWVNLPRALAEVQLFVDLPADSAAGTGRPSEGEVRGAVARIAWTAARHTRVEGLEVTFDGGAVPVPKPPVSSSSSSPSPPVRPPGAIPRPAPLGPTTAEARVPLPPFDPTVLHVLSAVVTFPDDSTARGDLAFGGPYGEEVATELTGVAVEVAEPRQLRSAAEAGDWLREGGESLPVVALDHGAADVFAVLDPESRNQRLAVLVGMARRMGQPGARLVRYVDPKTGETRFRADGIAARRSHPLRALGMAAGDRLHLVRPQLEAREDGLRLFAVSAALANDLGGTAWQLARHHVPMAEEAPPQLAEAVATVGLWATGRSRPRAVVLVLGPGSVDESRIEPAAARRYLDTLGVPLSVLYVELERPPDAQESRTESREARLAAARARWGGDVVDIAETTDWIRFFTELRERLDRQRVLWLRGRHLPQEVELADGAPPWLTRVGQEGDEPQRRSSGEEARP